MTNHADQPPGASADLESGIAAIHELMPGMPIEVIRKTVERTAALEHVDPGTCAQMLRTELEAGRLPADQFQALADLHGTQAS